MHNSIEADRILQQVVNPCHDTEDPEGEDPDTDNCDDRGIVPTLEPTEEAEEGGNDVNEQDSGGELP